MTELELKLEARRAFAAGVELARMKRAVVDADKEWTADDEPIIELWIANGLHRRWRVVSLGRTFGEFDQLVDAQTLLGLLLDGNPNFRRLA